MGPTIANISALLGLLPNREYFGLEYSPDAKFSYPEVKAKGKAKLGKTKHISTYKTWLLHFKSKGEGEYEVTDDEHIAFLIY